MIYPLEYIVVGVDRLRISSVTFDLDIYRAAKLVIDRHNDEAAHTCTGDTGSTNGAEAVPANAYVERLIGSIRRGCLDRMIILGEPHLGESCRSMPATTTKPARTSPSERTRRSAVRCSRLAGSSTEPMVVSLHHRCARI